MRACSSAGLERPVCIEEVGGSSPPGSTELVISDKLEVTKYLSPVTCY